MRNTTINVTAYMTVFAYVGRVLILRHSPDVAINKTARSAVAYL